ncbi:MAG: hypothetical protein R3D28_09625 [Geminicoccaceae bacterium]
MSVAGLCVAMISAISATWPRHAGHALDRRRWPVRHLGPDLVHAVHAAQAMYSLSSQPFSKMCQSIPQISGMSVPERSRTLSAWHAPPSA